LLELMAVQKWMEVCGEGISRVSEAYKVEDSKLFVRVESAPWRNELLYLKPQLISKLNRVIGREVIRDIVFTQA
jgi:predicted nucleic acid-binding Zn ribbon protein